MSIFINTGLNRPAASVVLDSMKKAKMSIVIISPYFSPTESMLASLLEKSNEKIHVKVVINIDDQPDKNAGINFESLSKLAQDEKIEIYKDTTFHIKAYLIDENELFIGSMNFSRLGFDERDEVIAKIIDREDILLVHRYIDALIERSNKLSTQDIASLEKQSHTEYILKITEQDLPDKKEERTFLRNIAIEKYKSIYRCGNKIRELSEQYKEIETREESTIYSRAQKVQNEFDQIDQTDLSVFDKNAQKILVFSKHFKYVKKDNSNLTLKSIYFIFYNILSNKNRRYNYEKMIQKFPEIFEVGLTRSGKDYLQMPILYSWNMWLDDEKLNILFEYKKYFDKSQDYPQPYPNNLLFDLHKELSEKYHADKLIEEQKIKFESINTFSIRWEEYELKFKIDIVLYYINAYDRSPSDLHRSYLEKKKKRETEEYKLLVLAINAKKSLANLAKTNLTYKERINKEINIHWKKSPQFDILI